MGSANLYWEPGIVNPLPRQGPDGISQSLLGARHRKPFATAGPWWDQPISIGSQASSTLCHGRALIGSANLYWEPGIVNPLPRQGPDGISQSLLEARHRQPFATARPWWDQPISIGGQASSTLCHGRALMGSANLYWEPGIVNPLPRQGPDGISQSILGARHRKPFATAGPWWDQPISIGSQASSTLCHGRALMGLANLYWEPGIVNPLPRQGPDGISQSLLGARHRQPFATAGPWWDQPISIGSQASSTLCHGRALMGLANLYWEPGIVNPLPRQGPDGISQSLFYKLFLS